MERYVLDWELLEFDAYVSAKFNLRMGDEYGRLWIGSSLVQIMAVPHQVINLTNDDVY